jgi:hypothetical protein
MVDCAPARANGSGGILHRLGRILCRALIRAVRLGNLEVFWR